MEEKQELVSYSPQGLISQALAQNVPIETLERLMDLSERWDAKQSKAAFLTAMSEFQKICPEIKKTKKGHNNKYADLANISKTIKNATSECGLSYRWEFEEIDDKIKCTCIVSHIAGHSEKNSMKAGKDDSGNKSDIHAIGSTRTYLQRYTLIGALGLSTADEDTDAAGKPKEAIPEPKAKNDPILDKINACKTRKELDAIWPTLTEKQQPNYIKDFQTKAETFKKK